VRTRTCSSVAHSQRSADDRVR